MRRTFTALILGTLLIFVASACNKSSPSGDNGTSTAAGPVIDEKAVYQQTRLLADLKSTSPERRTRAIQSAADLDAQGEDVIPTLLEALKDPTAGPLGRTSDRPDSTRETAVVALLGLKGKGKKALQERGLKTLEGGLRDGKPNVREHTANAIGLIGPDAKQSAAAVARLCTDGEKEVRNAAYRALERIKEVPPNSILRLLNHPNPQIAMEAASALSWLKPSGPESLEHLLEAIRREPQKNEEPSDIFYVRNKAAEAMAHISEDAEEAVPALVAMMTKLKLDDLGKMIVPSKDEMTKFSGPILALQRIGRPAVAAVVPLLKSDEPLIRYQAATVLGGMKRGEAAEALPKIQEALEAERHLPNGEMLIFEELAAATLVHGGGLETLIAGVIELLKNDDQEVRARSARMLARVGRKAAPAVPKLTELLNDPQTLVQAAAIEALGAIGPDAKSAVIELAKKVEGEDIKLGRAAAKALRGFGPAAGPAAPSLAKALDSNDSGFCAEAALTLAAIGPEAIAAIDAIGKHLLDEASRREERIALLNAAAAIGPPAKVVIPSVSTLLTRKEIPVQIVAAETLGKIGAGDAAAIKALIELLKDTKNTPQSVQHAILRSLAGMGASAKPAAEDVKAYSDQTAVPASKIWASATLVAIGSDADANAKVVLLALKDPTPATKSSRMAAIETAAFLGSRAKPGVPDLIELLKDSSPLGRSDAGSVREQAALTLGRLGATAKDAIRALNDMLREPDRAAKRAAAEALGMIGPDAIIAVPKLRELARTDPELAEVANAALDRIEPTKRME